MSDLRTLHTEADTLLTTVATVAYELAPDDQTVRRTHAEADGLLSRLVARGLEDRAAAAYPTSGDGPHVSSSSTSDPTGTAGVRDLTVVSDDDGTRFERRTVGGDYPTVCRTVQHVIGILSDTPRPAGDMLARAGARQSIMSALRSTVAVLDRCEQRLTPRATGEPCPTVARDDDGTIVATCQGTVTHHSTGRGLCERCDGDWRAQRGLQIPAEVIDARNARRRHACTCHDPAHGHDPGGCLGHGPPGETVGRCDSCRCACGPDCCPDGCADPRAAGRSLSERCKKRQDRRSTVGTGGAVAWTDQAGR